MIRFILKSALDIGVLAAFLGFIVVICIAMGAV